MTGSQHRPFGSGSAGGAMYALFLALGLQLGTPAVATPSAVATNDAVELNIPAGDLGTALKALGAATHQQFLFSNGAVAGIHTARLVGRYTIDDALKILLSGAYLKVDRTRSGVILIRRMAFIESGAAAGDAALPSTADAAVPAAAPTAANGGTNQLGE